MINRSQTRDFTWLSRCIRPESLFSSLITHIAVNKSRFINANFTFIAKKQCFFFLFIINMRFVHSAAHCVCCCRRQRERKKNRGALWSRKINRTIRTPASNRAVNKRLAKRPIPSYVFMRLRVACSYFSMQRGYRSSLPQLSVILKKKSRQPLSC